MGAGVRQVWGKDEKGGIIAQNIHTIHNTVSRRECNLQVSFLILIRILICNKSEKEFTCK